MKLTFGPFGGISPRTAPQFLEQNDAQVAQDVKLFSGELRPFYQETEAETLAKTGTIRTIQLYEDQYWLQWTADVDVAPSLVADDTEKRFYFTGEAGGPKKSNLALATTGGAAYPVTSYPLGVPAPTSPITAAVNSTTGASGETQQNYYYVYTHVTAWGEESAPGGLSNTVAFYDTHNVSLTGVATPPAGYNITSRRIYRSSVGTSGAEFQFLAEITDGLATTYTDTTKAVNLGEVCPSTDWIAPPSDLRGILLHPNGFLCGFSGRDIWFSEASYAFAWPVAYALTVDSPVVALGIYGSTIVVGTETFPYVVTGTDPSNMSATKLTDPAPCVSKRSMVSTPAGIAYATPDGLYVVAGGTGSLITTGKYTRDEWQKLHPETMHGHFWNGHYLGYYSDGAGDEGCIVVAMAGGNTVSQIDAYTGAAYVHPKTGKLYTVKKDAAPAETSTVFEWDADDSTVFGPFTWKSKLVMLPAMTNFTAARVEADFSADQIAYYEALADRQAALARNAARISAGDIGGEIADAAIGVYPLGGDSLEAVPVVGAYAGALFLRLKIYADGVLKQTVDVFSSKPFRLQGGYRSKQYSFQIEGNIAVKKVEIATSVGDLVEA